MKRFNVGGIVKKAPRRRTFVSTFLLILSTVILTTSASAAEIVVNGDFEVPDLTTFDPGTRAKDRGWTTFYGQNYTETCTDHLGSTDPLHDWEVECNNNILIPGWSVWWTDTLLMRDADGNLILNPAEDVPGRIEIQNNALPRRVGPAIAFARFGEQKAELDSHDRRSPVHISENPVKHEKLTDNNVSINQTLLTCPSQPYVLTYSWRSRTTIQGDNDVRVVVGDTIVREHQLSSGWVEETVNFVSDSNATSLAFISIGTGTTRGMSLDGVSVIGPTPDEFGNCPPPPGDCEVGSDDGSSDDGSSDDPGACTIPGASSSSSSSSHDGGSHDGGSHDGGSHDGGSHDGGSSDDGSSDDGSSDDSEGECGLCAGRGGLETLTLLYDGDDLTFQNQSPGESSVHPEPVPGGLPAIANIVVTDEGDGTVLFSGSVKVGETFDIIPGSTIRVEISDGGLVVQTVIFRTSCTQPLEVLDSFGGITIWDGSQ